MEKLEIYKTMFNNQGIDFGKYVYRCFLIIELGKSIFCPVKEFDDLYGSMEQNDNSVDEIITQESFHIINQLIFVYGQKVHDYDKWLTDNPESHNWLDIIDEYMILSSNFQNNPVQWYKGIYQTMVDNQFKTK